MYEHYLNYTAQDHNDILPVYQGIFFYFGKRIEISPQQMHLSWQLNMDIFAAHAIT